MIDSRRAQNRIKELYKSIEKRKELIKKESDERLKQVYENQIRDAKEAVVKIVEWFTF